MGVDSWFLEELAMDASLPSLWGFHESMEELKQKLLCTTLELEAVKANAKEEMRKSEQSIDQLLKLLQVVTHERDEARSQLELLLSKLKQIPRTRELRLSPMPDCVTGECGSSSSPVGSPELPSVKLVAGGATHTGRSDHSDAGAVMDWLAMNRPLPQKGKLLQAVMEAGPTLQTLLLAGPLPRWRNPPPLQQAFQVPPAAVKVPIPAVLNLAMKRPTALVAPGTNMDAKRQRTHCM
ncbi:uncharacterized protein LOC121983169 [Zingiber officinale]|uniref:Uncharacterized protein n=1 Tax=Zingiber officinale TaxID=94328 RepID=A0A8J5L1R1_ZINOF|nr:uncharacterized protein LOC121983169 [Zingiber officinale]KAG6507979.1 hypothetical protein ZIOFF_033334 [Zingiber officinale]